MNILIAGTGKMGRDIGLFLLTKGETVTWASRNAEFAGKFEIAVEKALRRIEIISAVPVPQQNFSVQTYDALSGPFDLVIENVPEDIQIKRIIFTRIKRVVNEKTILVSNSSSILPSMIGKDVIGLHFFYPVDMNRIIEVIFPNGMSQSKKNQLFKLLHTWDLDYLVQNEKNAFVVNRLLLPLQAEAFNLLVNGVPPGLIDECSRINLFPFGQLTFMDNVGLDVILPAIKNYTGRLPDSNQVEYENLIHGLGRLLRMGKLGKKRRNGLLVGYPLPWAVNPDVKLDETTLKEKLSQIFIGTCLNFLNHKQLTVAELDMVLKNIFGIKPSWSDLTQ